MQITPLTNEAKEFYEKIFLTKYKNLVESVNKTPLAILIWGPGNTGGNLYCKRIDILNALRESGHAAIFSEEIEKDRPIGDMSTHIKELLQAIEADFIVIIYGSSGSVAETHDFAKYIRDIGSKMLIFIDEEYQDGYGNRGVLLDLKTLYNNVSTYKYPDDIKKCYLLRSVQEKVKVLQHAKWLRENVR
ncbi:MAG: hypothetical protein AAB116_00465 [Candidatus Poribacteria bacterium]